MIPYLSKLPRRITINKAELQSSINWVLTKIVNNIEKLDKQKNILGYISNSVRNFCIDEYRKVVVRRRREDGCKNQAILQKDGVTPTLEFILEDITTNDREKTILTKIIIDKESIENIPQSVGISKEELDSFLERIRGQLS